jgi:ferrous iron transport protein A
VSLTYLGYRRGMPFATSPEILSLASVPLGATGLLALGDVPRSAGLRLAQLGLRAGAGVTVLARTAGGGRLVGVGTTRIGLDRDTSHRLGLRIGTSS